MIFKTIQSKGRLFDLQSPFVMGILNVTPDSFYDGGRYTHTEAAVARAAQMLSEGADILDIGGASSRPGAETVPESEEIQRVVPVIAAIRQQYPDAIISIDTWRAAVARAAVAAGADIVNDISAGTLDPMLIPTVAELQVPYILMHIQGTPQTMQLQPEYNDVATEVLDFLSQKVATLRSAGIRDIIIDPGFGFGKTIAHNYALLRELHTYRQVLQLPLLAGVSRKSMIYKLLNITAEESLPATTALHLFALQQGADILRVHDVREAVQARTLYQALSA